jgi:hypothetical protein
MAWYLFKQWGNFIFSFIIIIIIIIIIITH